MKFDLIDKICALDEQRIVAMKHVTMAEEYLVDHFPTFPVLPGVMMLEVMTQAAGWLLHHRRAFSCSTVALKEARNVRYGRFVAPGDWLTVEIEFAKDTPAGASFKASGWVGEPPQSAVSARLELAYFNLADKQPELGYFDPFMLEHTRNRFELLRRGNETVAV